MYACRCLFVVFSALASQLKQLICPINTLLAGLQDMPLTLAVALTMCHSSKASSLPRVQIPAWLNMHLGNILIRPGSHCKVWWSCDQCPEGFLHPWEASVLNRTFGFGCPFCSGNAVCQHNTLARQVPEVALFWDAKKNFPMSPDQVTVSSGMRAHWKCSGCLHEWQAKVVRKSHGKSGCPKCAKASAGRKARQKHPNFAAAQHALLQQWDHDRNRENGDLSDNTTLQSDRLIWWQCRECLK